MSSDGPGAGAPWRSRSRRRRVAEHVDHGVAEPATGPRSSSASTPLTPSTTASAWPAMRVATAGVPQAAASVSVMPQPSRAEAEATTHARR